MLDPDETLEVCRKMIRSNGIIGFSDDEDFFRSVIYYINLFKMYEKLAVICWDENGYRLRLNDTHDNKNYRKEDKDEGNYNI